ncbi:Hsp70 family protein [Cryptosporangium aurantiacum]|uniref:Hsp70 family protein n=1 Tax=Cryptosporangium aurantiacum TaxID=134849 RepID=UPI0015B81C6D|nr:Hsp70 family protein [Cryptosporangium aurantiacum]
MAAGYRLGVDFGTSNTVAVLAGPDRRFRPLLFDGQQQLPSAVCAVDGGLLVGKAAQHTAQRHPAAFEPHPKRHLIDGGVLLGEREWLPVEVVTSVFRRIADEVDRVTGIPTTDSGLDEVVLTHPAVWGGPRRQVLLDAAARVGWHRVRLVAEPLAAAAAFVHDHPDRLPPGAIALVYDLGAGTFDATVVRAEPDRGYTVLATGGIPDVGGADVDHAIVASFAAAYPAHESTWARLLNPATTADRRARWTFLEQVRTAKEILATSATTFVHVPHLDDEIVLGREQLDELTRPLIERTLAACHEVLRQTGLRPETLHAVFLVGGSTRLPGLTRGLHRSLGHPPTVLDQPELVVATGSLHVHRASAPPPPPFPTPAPAPPPPPPAPNARSARRKWLVVTAIATVVVLAGGFGLYRILSEADSPSLLRTLTGAEDANPQVYDSVVFSPDGKQVLTAGYQQIWVWETSTGRLLKQLTTAYGTRQAGLYGAVISPDGKRVVAGDSEGNIWLWDLTGPGEAQILLRLHQDYVSELAFSPDSRKLVSGGGGGTVYVWDVAKRAGDGGGPIETKVDSVRGLAFSRDGKTVAAVGPDGKVRLYDAESRTILGDEIRGTCVAFSPAAEQLLTGGTDKNVLRWNPETGERIGNPLSGHQDEVVAVTFSRDGNRAASAEDVGAVRLWDTGTGKQIGEPLDSSTKDGEATPAVAFSPDGALLASTSGRGVNLWSVPD